MVSSRIRTVTARGVSCNLTGMNDEVIIGALRVAGGLHAVTLIIACFTPVPRDWDRNLALLPEVHRRFAVAQNVFVGAVLAFCGGVSVAFAPVLAGGSPGGRIVCGGIALWWGARLAVLPWLRVWPELRGAAWKAGFVALHVQCATFALGYGWLALRN